MSSPSPSRMPVAVVGAGRMGRHHARTYSQIADAELVAVVDPTLDKARALCTEFGGEPLESVASLIEKFGDRLRAVTIATNTTTHEQAAVPLLEAGVGCLVEKPIAHDIPAGQAIVDAAAKGNAILQIGHTERFNPPVRALMALGLTPRYIEVDRVSPMPFRSLDVGVVMDVMIHDLEIVLALARSEVAEVRATGVAVLLDHEDVANARVVFANGCVANITASRMAMRTDRRLRVFSEEGFVSIDYQKRTGAAIQKREHDDTLRDIRARLRAGEDLSGLNYTDMVRVTDLATARPDASSDPAAGIEDPLTAELVTFLHCVRHAQRPPVDGAAGLGAVKLAQQILGCIRAHRYEGLGQPRVS